MPSRSRRAKERAKALADAELDSLLATQPSHLVGRHSSVPNPFLRAEEWARENPFGLVKSDNRGEPYLHENIGKGGNDRRHTDMWDDIEELKRRFPELWNKRSSAKEIAPNTAVALGLENNLSIRTVQKYQKLDRERKNARPS